MKHLFAVLILTMGHSLTAKAGNMKFTCKSSDGNILITRNTLVLLTPDDTKQYDLRVLNNLSGNTLQIKDEVTKFENELNDGTEVGQLKITAVSRVKTIASSDGEACDGGHGPGFSTEQYKLKGQFSIFDSNVKTIELTCVESYYWSGNCNFDEE